MGKVFEDDVAQNKAIFHYWNEGTVHPVARTLTKRFSLDGRCEGKLTNRRPVEGKGEGKKCRDQKA